MTDQTSRFTPCIAPRKREIRPEDSDFFTGTFCRVDGLF
jgi:hypothetical protein